MRIRGHSLTLDEGRRHTTSFVLIAAPAGDTSPMAHVLPQEPPLLAGSGEPTAGEIGADA